LRLQAWLKFEFQPRLYYWVLLPELAPGTWAGVDLLNLYTLSESNFSSLRAQWTRWIKETSGSLTAAQASHMDAANRNLNLAVRLVSTFGRDDEVWGLPYQGQTGRFNDEYLRTIFELNRRYGFTKFVVVVPSVAIKEGVYKTLQITEDRRDRRR
jgi:type III restriction enzyme